MSFMMIYYYIVHWIIIDFYNRGVELKYTVGQDVKV